MRETAHTRLQATGLQATGLQAIGLPAMGRRALLGGGASVLIAGVAAARPTAHAKRPPGPVSPIHPGVAGHPGVTIHRGAAIHRGAVPPLPLVMLDPGHGGKDPGAIGYAGTYEKHIAIAAANELRTRLLRTGRYRCVMTRTDDVFIPLEDRVAIAQGRQAALLLSMHADAIASRAVRGASVYTLSDTASDAQTAALATRENSADRFAGPSFATTSPEVDAILASLVRQETRVGSAHMAGRVVADLRTCVPLLVNPNRHAAFVVLKAPDIPSVLVEMGFMSNPVDEALLRTASHRARITVAILGAIDGYFSSAASFTRQALIERVGTGQTG